MKALLVILNFLVPPNTTCEKPIEVITGADFTLRCSGLIVFGKEHALSNYVGTIGCEKAEHSWIRDDLIGPSGKELATYYYHLPKSCSKDREISGLDKLLNN